MWRTSRLPLVILSTLFIYAGLSSVVQAADRVVVIPMSGAKTLQNVVTVSKANGRFTDPVAAVNSISDADATTPYLILIGPGQYTLTTALVMKPYVAISGSGENVTQLSGELGGSGQLSNSALITGANHTILSNLSIVNTGGDEESIGVYYPSGCDKSARVQQVSMTVTGGTKNYGIFSQFASPTMSGVTITVGSDVSGTTNHGVYNAYSSPAMKGMTISAAGGTTSYGTYNDHSSPEMFDVSSSAKYATDKNYGVYNTSSSSPVMSSVKAIAKNGTNSYGIYNISASNPVMTGVESTASGGTNGFSVVNNGSAPIMTGLNASASGTTNSHGVYNFNSSTVTIRRSTLSGDSNGLYLETGDVVTVSQSTIKNGVAVYDTGQTTCIACDNGSGHALSTTCTTTP